MVVFTQPSSPRPLNCLCQWRIKICLCGVIMWCYFSLLREIKSSPRESVSLNSPKMCSDLNLRLLITYPLLCTLQNTLEKKPFQSIILLVPKQLWKIKKHITNQLTRRIKKVHLLCCPHGLLRTGWRYQYIQLIYEWLIGNVSVNVQPDLAIARISFAYV